MEKALNVTQKFDAEADFAVTVYSWLLFSSVVCGLLQYFLNQKKSNLPVTTNVHFVRFQRKYFAAYFLALFGDWLQGPYIYKLYKHYGFTNFQIAVLYVVGFAASVLFGTGTGVLADKYGRKRLCMLFSLTYSLCCFMKISTSYNILLLGRLLGGISTSLLFSVFESWYVYEHTQNYDFPSEWISTTFSRATFWNGVMAIIAGIIANFTSETLGFGPLSPFILAIPCFIVSCCIILKTWDENYGKQKSSKNACLEGLQVIFSNNLIFMLGIVQSLFECVMYVFVFLWTPILDTLHPPLGLVFSTFMLCIMIGSSIYQFSQQDHKVSSQTMLLYAIVIALISQCGSALATSTDQPLVPVAFVSFLLLEVAVGIYFPAIGYIKSELIPESHRANIMNWYRVPLNIITCIILLSFHGDIDSKGNCVVFILCAGMMLSCSFLMVQINKMLPFVNSLPDKMPLNIR